MELPRHLQGSSSSASSHASSSPPGSLPRSPALATSYLPSPPLHPVPLPSSPSAPAQNRFGLALNFIHRRPRGQSLSANAPSTSPGSTQLSPAVSPAGENPPSPGGERERGGYGFPALRRQLSKRPSSSGSGSPAPDAARARTQRSASQPPAPSPNLATNASGSTPLLDAVPPSFSTPTPTTSSIPLATPTSTDPSSLATTHRLRLVPHLESVRSLHFDPVDRDLTSFVVLRVGRFTDRSHHPSQSSQSVDPLRIAFKSKVVSRGHAEVWCDEAGKFFIRDTKSSSGTFLNHIRLSGPGAESRPFPLKDGDVLQLGVDYQGGTEEIYRCIKMKVELNRGWQRGMNSFNTNALAQLRALGGGTMADSATARPATASTATVVAGKANAARATATSVTDCCICLYPVTVCQALFIAPCSHVTHFKCIRPLLLKNYPGFSCPLCRTYADLEADVEIDDPWEPIQPETVEEESEEESTDVLPSDDDPLPSIQLQTDSDRSRPASFALTDADGTSVPSMASHLRLSRPSSLHDEPSSLPISIPLSSVDSEALYASLADAATPPNSTFLSTLADNDYARYAHPVVSLDQAFDRFASGSTGGAEGPGPSVVLARARVGNEEETVRREEGKGKGKGKGREVEELGKGGTGEEAVVL